MEVNKNGRRRERGRGTAEEMMLSRKDSAR